ncbi:hypothetical protein I553_4089 [Mycobacterium xenopi 4042]|uniref:Spermatogenesis-associated protein 20-like TRX domain-containing protein n=1 Tax=Mycobacterium xenopi 4042 TaxID=1299334 RepID=X8AFB6_MYCXE|nr:hypothetical protein I553_4089 [Mycobacterium xenopi 4042]
MSPAANTLAGAASPYLRQHADNPVHWQQWTPQALAEAAERDVPILLSVGYAACHWCHVMAHESFEDDEVAAAMNAGFVCIKVDREERPDIDGVYMNATVALTGQGGWPMTCFLTPDGRPFFCGTYYPKHTFLQLLSAVSATWRDRRDEVEQAADHIARELRAMSSGLPAAGPEVTPELCDHAVAAVLRDEDTVHGGFGGAPKFPPSALLEALLRHHERTGSPAALQAVERTCTAMARGGIYDQLAGGFARYSVDNAWVVPHFEKMLYDNALLLRVYAHWARRTGNPLAHRVSRETAQFMLDELADGNMFTSSLDADAAGREGSTYVWTPGQLREVLGDDDGHWAASVFGVTEAGTFEAGPRCCSCRPIPTTPIASNGSAPRCWPRVRPDPNRTATTRSSPPGTGLPLPHFRKPVWRWMIRGWPTRRGDAPRRWSGCIWSTGGCDGQPGRAGRRERGHSRRPCHAGDRAVDAPPVDRGPGWLATAIELLDIALAHFADPDQPGRWFDSADDAEQLMARPADPTDGATPSGPRRSPKRC